MLQKYILTLTTGVKLTSRANILKLAPKSLSKEHLEAIYFVKEWVLSHRLLMDFCEKSVPRGNETYDFKIMVPAAHSSILLCR